MSGAPLKFATRRAGTGLVWIAALGLLAMTVIIGWQVFGRYVLGASPNWTEQASLILMIWYVNLAAAAGVREGFHIRIVALEDAANPLVRRGMRIANDGVLCACGAAMVVFGGQLVVGTWPFTIPTLGLPRGFAYLGIPISGALIVIFCLERIIEELVNDEPVDQEDPRWS